MHTHNIHRWIGLNDSEHHLLYYTSMRYNSIQHHLLPYKFYRQLDFSSQPGVDNEILENEPKLLITVRQFFKRFSED